MQLLDSLTKDHVIAGVLGAILVLTPNAWLLYSYANKQGQLGETVRQTRDTQHRWRAQFDQIPLLRQQVANLTRFVDQFLQQTVTMAQMTTRLDAMSTTLDNVRTDVSTINARMGNLERQVDKIAPDSKAGGGR
jgi:hypothetical protein